MYVLPFAHCLTKAIAVASGLLQSANGSALVATMNAIPKKIVIPKVTILDCVADSEPLSAVPLEPVPAEIPSAGCSASSSALPAAISSDLTLLQTQQLLALLFV